MDSKLADMDSKLAHKTHKILSLDYGEVAESSLDKLSKAEAPGICLPKISVPPSDGNILNWTSFGNSLKSLCIAKTIYKMSRSCSIP